MSSYPQVTQFMCYFHIVKNCKEKLRAYGKDVQRDVLLDVQNLHNCISETDCQSRLRQILPKWKECAPDFLHTLCSSGC